MAFDNGGSLPGNLSFDACLELLAHHQRRIMMAFSLNRDKRYVSIDELVSHLLDEEGQRMGQRPGYEHMTAALYHVHLPKFEDIGVLKYETQIIDIRYHGVPCIEDVYRQLRDRQSNW